MDMERQPDRLRVAVVGAGSWGTALAIHAARSGHDVEVWGHDPVRAERVEERRENEEYLPGVEFPPEVRISGDGAAVLAGAELVLSVVPSRYLREVWTSLGDSFPGGAHLVSCTKGIELDSGLRMSQVLAECLGGAPLSVGALSGPSFARELVEFDPTAVTLGCADEEAACAVQESLSFGNLRVYRNPDIVGVELGGALKNIIAVAAGIVDGLGLGTNTRAALITRGLKEITDLAVSRGARAATMTGLAGLGDLVLTCTGPLSRNRSVGVEVGKGRTLDEITADTSMVAEGVFTVRSARQVAAAEGIEMPITEQVHQVLYAGKDPREAIEDLMARELVEE